jgi:hydrogenase maturation protease
LKALAPLVIGIGNLSRGDDALGPRLIDALEAAGAGAELMCVYQLQPEHALDLAQHPAVLIVDAAQPGSTCGVQLQRLQPQHDHSWSSHALSPSALLQLCVELHPAAGAVPPVWLLAIEGEQFELGAELSQAAQARLAQAVTLAVRWCEAGSR